MGAGDNLRQLAAILHSGQQHPAVSPLLALRATLKIFKSSSYQPGRLLSAVLALVRMVLGSDGPHPTAFRTVASSVADCIGTDWWQPDFRIDEASQQCCQNKKRLQLIHGLVERFDCSFRKIDLA